MHDRLFGGAEARVWGSGGQGDFNTFLGYAQELKLDSTTFQHCLEAKQHAFQIDTDYRTALQQGVRSTPTFVINGKLLIGAYPYETWRQVLDDLLPKQQIAP
jgi:predicted DsbA family dithiol-disulfide isomerase